MHRGVRLCALEWQPLANLLSRKMHPELSAPDATLQLPPSPCASQLSAESHRQNRVWMDPTCESILQFQGAYLQLDPRLQSLILALRHWARTAGILGREVGHWAPGNSPTERLRLR